LVRDRGGICLCIDVCVNRVLSYFSPTIYLGSVEVGKGAGINGRRGR